MNVGFSGLVRTWKSGQQEGSRAHVSCAITTLLMLVKQGYSWRKTRQQMPVSKNRQNTCRLSYKIFRCAAYISLPLRAR